MIDIRKYIIIVGSGRTGTTGLSQILSDSNDEIAYLPELKFFFMGLSNRKTLKTPLEIYKRSLTKFLKFNTEYEQKIDINESCNLFLESLQTIDFENEYVLYKYILDFLIDEILDHKIYKYVILQTPANLFMLNLINKTIGTNYIIYTIRDARSFLASAFFKKDKWAKDYINLIAYWNYSNNHLLKMQKKYHGILIKQENLLLSEEDEIKKIANVFNLNLKHVTKTNLINSSFKNKNKEETLNNYKKLFNSNEINTIEFLTKNNLIIFNYNIGNIQPINVKIIFFYYIHYFKISLRHFFIVNGFSDILYKVLNK